MSILEHFAEISRRLDKGRHYIMVVGDSSVSNIFFKKYSKLVLSSTVIEIRIKEALH